MPLQGNTIRWFQILGVSSTTRQVLIKSWFQPTFWPHAVALVTCMATWCTTLWGLGKAHWAWQGHLCDVRNQYWVIEFRILIAFTVVITELELLFNSSLCLCNVLPLFVVSLVLSFADLMVLRVSYYTCPYYTIICSSSP